MKIGRDGPRETIVKWGPRFGFLGSPPDPRHDPDRAVGIGGAGILPQ